VQHRDNLIWIDLEMTGLKTESDTIIEIATVVTDAQLRVLAEGPVLAIHTSDEVLAAMDEWNTRQHGASGLTARVKESHITLVEAETQTLAFLLALIPGGIPGIGAYLICWLIIPSE
jgi:oligoribonuclease